MRIATWNVNSIGKRVPRFLPWLDERAPDVVCLQETKVTDAAFAELVGTELSDRGYEVAVHGEAARARAAVTWPIRIEQQHRRARLPQFVRGPGAEHARAYNSNVIQHENNCNLNECIICRYPCNLSVPNRR